MTPSVQLVLTVPATGTWSWLAFSERGARGTGGPAAYEALHAALSAGEANAGLVGLEVRRVLYHAS